MIALLSIGCEAEQKMLPDPVLAGDAARMENVAALRPHVQKLVEEMKAGRLLGAAASEFHEQLEMADKLTRAGKITAYGFYANPKTAGQEGSPVLVIHVQNKFGHIVLCRVVSVEY